MYYEYDKLINFFCNTWRKRKGSLLKSAKGKQYKRKMIFRKSKVKLEFTTKLINWPTSL